MASLRSSFTPVGLHSASAPPASGWTRTNAPPRKRSRWLTLTLVLGATTALGSWTAVRHVPWVGPLVADTLRAVVGGERVTALEEAVASVEDHVARVTNDGKARSLGDATPAALLATVESDPVGAALGRAPKDVAPLFPAVAAPDDGAFRPLPTRFDTGSAIYRTMLHPFNGGFKAEHGEFGMRVGGTELLGAKSYACTFAGNDDGAITIGTFSKLATPSETYA